MKKIIILIALICLYINAQAQELPKNFRTNIEKEYKEIPEKVKREELKMNLESFYELRKSQYLDEIAFQKHLRSSNKSASNMCDDGTFSDANSPKINDWLYNWQGGNSTPNSGTVTPTISGNNRINTGSFAGAVVSHDLQRHHEKVLLGNDPKVFSLLSQVNAFPTNNTSSLRLGNAHSKFGLERIIKKNVLITPTNSILSFSYAFVGQEPAVAHGTDNPHFAVYIKLSSSGSMVNSPYNNLLNLGNGSNKLITNDSAMIAYWHDDIRYRGWDCVTADLSTLIGETIDIIFENRDCTIGGHWGYTYLDNICMGCDGAPSVTGTVEVNQTLTDSCGIPGKICVNYTVPDAASPIMQIDLQLIQNGVVVQTISSPNFNSDGNYCFNLSPGNTAGLNNSLSGFDYRIIGHPSSGSFNFADKIIGTVAAGVNNGANNDYEFICYSCPCPTPLNFMSTTNVNIPARDSIISNIPFSIANEQFNIGSNATIPITEVRVVVRDVKFEYDQAACATCKDNSGLWGTLFSPTQTIGNATNGLLSKNSPSLMYGIPSSNMAQVLNNRAGVREIIWSNPNGAMLQAGQNFTLQYLLPPGSPISCCASRATVCIEITSKDANCKTCTVTTCSTIEIKK